MPGSPLKILIGLVAAAFLSSGWLFAWMCERETSGLREQVEGMAFTDEEQVLINLQDQLQIARSENARLGAEVQKLTDQLEAAEAEQEEAEKE